MFSRIKVQNKVVLLVASVTLLALVIASSIAVMFSRASISESGLDYAQEVARSNALIVKSELSEAILSARTLAQGFESLSESGNADRTTMNLMMKQVLKRSPRLLGVWTAWEPNALDDLDQAFAGTEGHDATGRFIPYWYRADGQIGLEPLIDYDKPGAGDYYLLARDSGDETVLEPYIYAVGGVDTLITSLSVPIEVNGKIVGVAGVDIALADIQSRLAEIRPFGDGRVTLMSADGLIVADENIESLGKNAADFGFSSELLTAIRNGEALDLNDARDSGGEAVIQASRPLFVGTSKRPWSMVVTAKRSTVFAAADQISLTLILTTIAISLVAGILAFWLGRRISKPITVITAVMRKLAEGETEAEVTYKDRHDEIGEMAQAVQVFKDNALEMKRLEQEKEEQSRRGEEEKQQAMIEMANSFELKIKGVVDSVSSASTEMNATAKTMSQTAEQTEKQATSAAAATEQAASNVQTVASSAEELSSSINEISGQVNRSSEIANSAVQQAERTNEQVTGLVEAARKIGDVVNLISDIAEQTNLLALNATIEAARAGEAGKGFAVVASEVKSLATQTAKATDEIGQQISAIQSATTDSAEAIKAIAETIAEINQIAGSVSAAVEEQGAATQEIARSVQEASAGTAQVSSSMEEVTMTAGESGRSANDVLKASDELSSQSELLRREVDSFISSLKVA